MGILGTTTKYGAGFGLLANAFFADGEGGGLGVDDIEPIAEYFGVDPAVFEHPIVSGLIEGNERALSVIAGSAVAFSGQFRQAGVIVGVAMLAFSWFKQYQAGKLDSLFGQAAASDVPSVDIEP